MKPSLQLSNGVFVANGAISAMAEKDEVALKVYLKECGVQYKDTIAPQIVSAYFKI